MRQTNGTTMPKPVIKACSNRKKDIKKGLSTCLKLVNYFKLMPIKRLLSLVDIFGKAEDVATTT